MSAVARVGDLCTGHPPYPPRPAITGSDNVFVNGKAAHRVGDVWADHPHTGILVEGSGNVYVNGQKLGRTGDLISCGSRVGNGSPDVFANG